MFCCPFGGFLVKSLVFGKMVRSEAGSLFGVWGRYKLDLTELHTVFRDCTVLETIHMSTSVADH